MKDTNSDDRSSGISANCCGSQQTSAPTSGAEPPTLDELHDQWESFVERVRDERISVGSLLGEARPIVVSEGVIWILVPKTLHRDVLRDHRHYLAERASDTWRAKVEGVQVVTREDFTECLPDQQGPDEQDPPSPESESTVEYDDLFGRPALESSTEENGTEEGSTEQRDPEEGSVGYDDLFGRPALESSTDEGSPDDPPPPEGCLSEAERELYDAAFEVARERPDELLAVLEVVQEGLRCGKEAAQGRGGRYE